MLERLENIQIDQVTVRDLEEKLTLKNGEMSKCNVRGSTDY